jgi:DNA (cytosine-5)-methyltransferase 1
MLLNAEARPRERRTKGKDSRISYVTDPALPAVVDLFAGCGGLSLGFQRAGFDVRAGFDSWESAVDVYNDNLDHEAHVLDLSDTKLAIKTLAPYMKTGVDGVIGGPPCQDFSSAGKRVEGDRADLTERYAEILVALKPRFFLMENVARALNADAYQRALETMREAGYGITVRVLDAAYCGVPQSRKRLFAVGVHGAEDGFLDEALTSGLSVEPMTLRDAFKGSLGIEHYYRHPRSYARRAVFSIDEPSPTVRGVNRPVPDGYPGHQGDTAPAEDVRPLTTRERALVQTFPGEFRWDESKTNVEQMIGNAVPVNLAAYVAGHLGDYLRSTPPA